MISLLLFLASVFTFFVFQYNAKKDAEILQLQQESDRLKTDILYYDMLERQNNNLSSYAHDTKIILPRYRRSITTRKLMSISQRCSTASMNTAPYATAATIS